MRVNGISDDGLTVVGQSGAAGSTAPAYWTQASGWTNLPLPTGTTDGEVFAANTDGLWMAGSAKLSGGNFVPARWGLGGTAELVPAPAGVAATDAGAVVAISGNGLIVVGNWNAMPFRWGQALGATVISNMNEALALSLNGSTVGGIGDFTYGTPVPRGALWTDSGGAVEVGTDQTLRVQSVSSNGAVAAGTNKSSLLFLFSGGSLQTFTGATHRHLSNNGLVLVGEDAGGTFLWTAAAGKKTLVQTLGDAGFTGNLAIWVFDGPVYVSGDGKRLAGGLHDKASGKLMFFYAVLP